MNILLSGGLGYIGCHTAVSLHGDGHKISIIDNLCNSSSMNRTTIEKIICDEISFYEGDIRDKLLVQNILVANKIDLVIHFAALKSVADSFSQCVDYFENNVSGTISLVSAMKNANVSQLVFSSSATVYGSPEYLPIDEDHRLGALNPYGRSKLICEEILSDIAFSSAGLRVANLRYFNPIGAHHTGLIGDWPINAGGNLMPAICRVAAGINPHIDVFGSDYNTTDGTGVRDYIHVVDLADAHLAAALNLQHQKAPFRSYNIGMGSGISVLNLIETFKKTNNVDVRYEFKPRRDGDVAICFSDPSRANSELGWKATSSVKDMCESSWRAFRLALSQE